MIRFLTNGMVKGHMRVLAVALCLAASHSTSSANDPLISIQAFLVSGQTGKLSYDIADPQNQFSFWNTMIADGIEVEPSLDVLIIAHFIQQGNAEPPFPGFIKAKVPSSGETFKERRIDNLLFIDGNRATASMLVESITCASIDIEVSLGKSSRTINLPFACGE